MGFRSMTFLSSFPFFPRFLVWNNLFGYFPQKSLEWNPLLDLRLPFLLHRHLKYLFSFHVQDQIVRRFDFALHFYFLYAKLSWFLTSIHFFPDPLPAYHYLLVDLFGSIHKKG